MCDILTDGTAERQNVEAILKHYFQSAADIDQCHAEVISKGLGFTSDVMRVELTWKDGNNNKKNDGKLLLPTKVIVKVIKISCMDDIMSKFAGDGENGHTLPPQDKESNAKAALMIHKAECEAYKVLMAGKPIPVPIPTIYGYSEENPSVIVMEDLGDKAAIVPNIADGLTLGQWRSVTESLADLHAWSLTTDVPWKDYIVGGEKMFEMFKNFTDMTVMGMKTASEKYPEHLGHLDEELLRKEIVVDRLMENYEHYKKLIPEVMQHGDTWVNNMMFEKKADGSLSDKLVALIDWQISFCGCGLNDLARLSSFCINSDIRKKRDHEILRNYYDRLCKKSAGKFTVPFETVEKVYNHALALNGLFCVALVDFMLQFIAKVAEDPTGWRQQEMLSRMKTNYDDAAAFFRANPKPFA